MEVAALVALTLLLGALVILVAVAVGRRKEEIREETEQAADLTGKSHTLANVTQAEAAAVRGTVSHQLISLWSLTHARFSCFIHSKRQ